MKILQGPGSLTHKSAHTPSEDAESSSGDEKTPSRNPRAVMFYQGSFFLYVFQLDPCTQLTHLSSCQSPYFHTQCSLLNRLQKISYLSHPNADVPSRSRSKQMSSHQQRTRSTRTRRISPWERFFHSYGANTCLLSSLERRML